MTEALRLRRLARDRRRRTGEGYLQALAAVRAGQPEIPAIRLSPVQGRAPESDPFPWETERRPTSPYHFPRFLTQELIEALAERLQDYDLAVPVAQIARWSGGRRLQVWDWVLAMSRVTQAGLRLAPPVYLRRYQTPGSPPG